MHTDTRRTFLFNFMWALNAYNLEEYLLLCGMQCPVVQCKSTNISEEYTAFRIQEEAKEESRKKQVTSRASPLILHAAYILSVTCLAHSLTLKMEAVHSSKTSVDFCWDT
jgi:hypothetical protein